MRVYRIARAAQDDLDEIWCYIGRFDVRVADRWLGVVEGQFRALSIHPEVGQARPDISPKLRFLPIGNYLIFYRVIEDGVEIARVIHGSRDYGPDFSPGGAADAR